MIRLLKSRKGGSPLNTISPEYAEMNKKLHATCSHYGCKSSRHKENVLKMLAKLKGKTVLDYGCGKGSLVIALKADGVEVQGYDPGHPDYCSPEPQPADVLVCTDVLEHIEPELLPNVLSEIRRLSVKGVYLVIALRHDSSKLLPDGTNPHKIVQSIDNWLADMQGAWGRHRFFVTILDHAIDKQVTISVTWQKKS